MPSKALPPWTSAMSKEDLLKVLQCSIASVELSHAVQTLLCVRANYYLKLTGPPFVFAIEAESHHSRPNGAPADLVAIVDDVNSGLFGRRCSPADTDVLGHQLCLRVFAKPSVRSDKSTRSHPPNLASLRELDFTLGFVGPSLFIFVERVTDSRQRILLFLCKLLLDAFRGPEGTTSERSFGRRISLVEYIIDAAVDQRVLGLKLVVVLRAVLACRRPQAEIPTTHHSTTPFTVSRWQSRTIPAFSILRQSASGRKGA